MAFCLHCVNDLRASLEFCGVILFAYDLYILKDATSLSLVPFVGTSIALVASVCNTVAIATKAQLADLCFGEELVAMQKSLRSSFELMNTPLGCDMISLNLVGFFVSTYIFSSREEWQNLLKVFHESEQRRHHDLWFCWVLCECICVGLRMGAMPFVSFRSRFPPDDDDVKGKRTKAVEHKKANADAKTSDPEKLQNTAAVPQPLALDLLQGWRASLEICGPVLFAYDLGLYNDAWKYVWYESTRPFVYVPLGGTVLALFLGAINGMALMTQDEVALLPRADVFAGFQLSIYENLPILSSPLCCDCVTIVLVGFAFFHNFHV